MKLPILPWLLSSGAGPTDRVLVVQTGSPLLVARLVESLLTLEPDLKITVLLQKNMRGLVPGREGVEYLDNPGPKPSFVRELHARSFDRAYVIFSNEPGYWKLKLLPFVVGARLVYAVNENLDWFPVDLRHSEQIAAHARWRMESSVTFAGAVEMAALWNAAKAAAYPAVLAYLAGFEALRSLRAGGRAASWKAENRPGGSGP